MLRMVNLDWPVPGYSALCRRQKTLAVQIPDRRAEGPLNLLVDSSGIKFPGGEAGPWPRWGRVSPPNEWQVGKHGVQGHRQSLPGRRMRAFAVRGRKVHPAMATATSDIRARSA